MKRVAKLPAAELHSRGFLARDCKYLQGCNFKGGACGVWREGRWIKMELLQTAYIAVAKVLLMIIVEKVTRVLVIEEVKKKIIAGYVSTIHG